MKKLLLFLALFALVVYSQPPPPGGNEDDGEGAPPPPTQGEIQAVQAMTVKSGKPKPPKDWYCDIEFYYNGKPYFYESLSYGEEQAYRGSFPKKYNNKIDEVYWSGSRCYCWIVVYQDKYFKGLNLGLWTDSTDGYYDLSHYITYDFKDHAWETWDSTVSSYSIYCY